MAVVLFVLTEISMAMIDGRWSVGRPTTDRRIPQWTCLLPTLGIPTCIVLAIATT